MNGPTLLARWLSRRGAPSYAAFADMVGADRQRIYRYARGERYPALHTALEIEKVTAGRVPAGSWPVRRPPRSAANRSPRPE